MELDGKMNMSLKEKRERAIPPSSTSNLASLASLEVDDAKTEPMHGSHSQVRFKLNDEQQQKELNPSSPHKSALKKRSPSHAFGLDNAILGDYGLTQSQSTQNLLAKYLDISKFDRTNTRSKMLLPTAENASVAGPAFNLIFKHYREGVEVILDDNFWKCFKRRRIPNWNFNIYLLPVWIIGALFRYFILFPLRLVTWILCLGIYFVALWIIDATVDKKLGRRYKQRCVQAMCGVFFFTWGAVVTYHGTFPKQNLMKKNGKYVSPVFVSNHSSIIDAIILVQRKPFSLIGQQQKGFAGFLQETSMKCMDCVWFNRGEVKDRAIVASKLQAHCFNEGKDHVDSVDDLNNPLLVFPEGTCVNNENIIQFKKGVFELGVPICPVAIKYQKVFCDPFWNSQELGFGGYIMDLMRSWALIADVYFLEPMEIRPGETSIAFTTRVQKKIAKKINLPIRDFDGYMKHWKPSQRYVNARQERFSESLKSVFEQADVLRELNAENNADNTDSMGKQNNSIFEQIDVSDMPSAD